MAIPQGRMSTTPVLGEYLPPEGVTPHPLTSYEVGPIDVEDTTEGLLYQTWRLSWDGITGDFTLKAEDTLEEYIIGNSFDVTHASFTFDQSGRVTFAWTNTTSSYFRWYDTQIGQTVIEDLGADVFTPTIYLDDKRPTQNTANDMLLFYTKFDGIGQYNLYMKVQRERFLVETLMISQLDSFYIIACGMTGELRVQLRMRSAGYTGEQPPVIDPANLHFEFGDTNWTQETGVEFTINQNAPETGVWNASLVSTGAYSIFVNDTFYAVTGGQQITLGIATMGTVGQGLSWGYQHYDASFNYLGRSQFGINVEAAWANTEWITNVPANAVHIRLCVSSNGVVGTFHLDNLTIAGV